MKKQLVIIPGWDGTKQSWREFIKIAQNDFEVFCLEMPCFGNNPCPNDVCGVDEYADYVAKEIIGLEKPIILGHSFGGQVAVNLVARKKKYLQQTYFKRGGCA
ncbi:MAG: alpha/beta fold hydrolase [Candidatus Uhrbacteria bacterium]